MNNTPRMRSSYPATPDTARPNRSASQNDVPERKRSTLPKIPQQTTGNPVQPLIPTTILDAPSQRFYVVAVYVLLLAWRLYDWGKLVDDEADSFWLFIKWVAVDGIFLYGLPGLRIPWLEWSNPVITAIFLAHAAFNGMLMFRIALPIEAALAALVKTLYDRELAISENRVKPSSILHNSSLIMGRTIINVLPEGSAILNPDRLSFCVDDKRTSVRIPLRLNETTPISIQLFRLGFEAADNETIEISNKEIKSMLKHARKTTSKHHSGPIDVEYTVKRPGLYRLLKVIDESKLEVQRRVSDTLVVTCPSALIKPTTADRCVGELSDLTIDVTGTPPLKIVYSQTINRKDSSFHFQSIQPENLVSPLVGNSQALTLISRGNEDVSWARPHTIGVRLNESMVSEGKWLYSIDEVHDAAGNVINFTSRGEDGEHIYPKGTHLEQALTVHQRPQVHLEGYDTQRPLRVPTGKQAQLPLRFGPIKGSTGPIEHTVIWQFSPIDTLTADGDHGTASREESFLAKGPNSRPLIEESGLYTLRSVRNSFCDGEVKEPASFLLINPAKPNLTIASQDIANECAGNAIGLRVDLDLTGTPPFRVHYEVIRDGRHKKTYTHTVNGLRSQLELTPPEAGHYLYRFTSIDDSVYAHESLDRPDLELEQDVKPSASAFLAASGQTMQACIDEPVEFDVMLAGEPPFTLEYELVYGGKRNKRKIKDIQQSSYKISTGSLHLGGEYALALASVEDKTGCKIFLNGEAKINVRRQRPKVSFAKLDGKRSITTLDDGRTIQLPVRLEGESPWEVSYRNIKAPEAISRVHLQGGNSFFDVVQDGIYELVDVRDKACPGIVDIPASTFNVAFIERPRLKFSDNSGLTHQGSKFLKREVCEGDVDAIEVILSGTPPYQLGWQQHLSPLHGAASTANKKIDIALGLTTVAMDTSKAGLCSYKFSELSDNSYDHEAGKLKPLVVEQTVNPRPSAKFSKPGQSYKYCKEEESGDEMIPITLTGLPPFSLEIDIKHQSSARPETIKIANIESNQYSFRIPHAALSLGTHHVSVRKVRDSRGCQQKTEYGGPNVQVQVYDVPTIYPLESRSDYCVGDRISYTLSGTPPFDIHYTFNGHEQKAKSQTTNFRRIAEKPGEFIITAVADKASECRARTSILKTIHQMPSVKVSHGKQVEVDIHEGGEAEILFEFWGTPPFEFTYTRSTNARKGHKSVVLETRHDVSEAYEKRITSSMEGTYEVVAIKDKFCSFSVMKEDKKPAGQKLLQY